MTEYVWYVQYNVNVSFIRNTGSTKRFFRSTEENGTIVLYNSEKNNEENE